MTGRWARHPGAAPEPSTPGINVPLWATSRPEPDKETFDGYDYEKDVGDRGSTHE